MRKLMLSLVVCLLSTVVLFAGSRWKVPYNKNTGELTKHGMGYLPEIEETAEIGILELSAPPEYNDETEKIKVTNGKVKIIPKPQKQTKVEKLENRIKVLENKIKILEKK